MPSCACRKVLGRCAQFGYPCASCFPTMSRPRLATAMPARGALPLSPWRRGALRDGEAGDGNNRGKRPPAAAGRPGKTEEPVSTLAASRQPRRRHEASDAAAGRPRRWTQCESVLRGVSALTVRYPIWSAGPERRARSRWARKPRSNRPSTCSPSTTSAWCFSAGVGACMPAPSSGTVVTGA